MPRRSPAKNAPRTIRHHTRRRAPHFVVEFSGRVSGTDVRRAFADLPDTLAALPPDFVALLVYPDLILLEPEAVPPLFYFVTYLFDADPGLCVFVDGGKSPHPGLRAFIERVSLAGQAAFVPTRAAADDRIRTFRRR